MAIGLFALNDDVLSIIVSLIGPYDTFQLSLTCREAQKAAVPYFLEAVAFPLPWLCSANAKRSPMAYPELFEGFRAYMRAHASRRLQYLKSLVLAEDAFCIQHSSQHLEPPRYNFTLAAPLADVIRGAVELRTHTVWPALRELRLARGPLVDLQAMSRAFPNLRRLHVECLPAAIVPLVGKWCHLDFVFTIHPLPLQHPVRHLKMNWFSLGPYVPTPQHQVLVDSTSIMLQNAQPLVLECSACKSTYSCIARNTASVRFLKITGVPVRQHSDQERILTEETAAALLVSSNSTSIITMRH